MLSTIDKLKKLKEAYKDSTDDHMIGVYNGFEIILSHLECRPVELRHCNGTSDRDNFMERMGFTMIDIEGDKQINVTSKDSRDKNIKNDSREQVR